MQTVYPETQDSFSPCNKIDRSAGLHMTNTNLPYTLAVEPTIKKCSVGHLTGGQCHSGDTVIGAVPLRCSIALHHTTFSWWMGNMVGYWACKLYLTMYCAFNGGNFCVKAIMTVSMTFSLYATLYSICSLSFLCASWMMDWYCSYYLLFLIDESHFNGFTVSVICFHWIRITVWGAAWAQTCMAWPIRKCNWD